MASKLEFVVVLLGMKTGFTVCGLTEYAVRKPVKGNLN